MVPDRKPRTEWGSQPVAFISSLAVTPPGRVSRSRILAVLLPSRATSGFSALASVLPAFAFVGPLGAFFAGVAFFLDLVLAGATGARRGARAAFLLGFGWAPAAVTGAEPVSSGINVVISLSPFAAIVAVTTWITLIGRNCKRNLRQPHWRRIHD